MTAAHRLRLHDRLLLAANEGLEPNLRRWLGFLGPGQGWTELQILGGPKKWEENQYAHVDTIDQAVALCQQIEKLAPVGTYVIGNAIDPAISTRAPAGRWHVQKQKEGTTDADIRARRALYIDVDWQRPRGISSTAPQLVATHDALDTLWRRLEGIVGPGPIGVGHSGNGGAIFLALADLPETPELASLLKGILAAIAQLHQTSTIKIDQSVSDPKRLMPAFGTMKRKGAPGVAERPHRRTSFLCADNVERLDVAALERLFAALMADLTAEQKAEVEKAQGRKKVASAGAPKAEGDRPAPRPSGEGNSAFRRANESPIGDVLDWLGLRDGERPKCPGCGESDSGVAIVGNGLKCSHNRCSAKGYQAGFRTVVDLVVEVQGLEPVEAVRALADRFGFDPPRPRAVDPPPSASRPKTQAPVPPPEAPEMLLPFKTPEHLPRFPVDSLPSPVRAFVLAVAHELEVPVDLPAILCFGAMATALMGKYQVEASPGWLVPLNLYAVVALPSGELKSAAFKRAFRPLYDYQRELRVDWEAEKRRIESDNAQRAPGEPEAPVPPCPRIFADDVTPEALARLLADHDGRMTIASDEGTIFGMMCGLYSEKPNNGIFLKGHDGSTFIVDRKIGPSTYLESPLLNLTLAVQPSVIQSLAEKPDLRGNGLWARFLYSFPIPRVGTKTLRTPSVSESERLRYSDWLKDLARRSPPDHNEGTLRISGEANDLLIDSMVKVDRESAPGCSLASVADWASKLRGEVIRLAGLIHVAEHGQAAGGWISVETMARALELGRYFLAHARHAFQQEMTLDKAEAASLLLWQVIQRKGWQRFTQREVQHHVSSLRKGEAAATAIKGLVERAYLRAEKEGRRTFYVVTARPAPQAASPPPTAGPGEPPPDDPEDDC